MTEEAKPWDEAQIQVMRRASGGNATHKTSTSRWLATLDERTRERDEARADAARDAGLEEMAREEAERMLRSACDLRDALDSVARALGVDTSTDAETSSRACVEAIAALCEEVDRLRSAVGGEQESAEQQRESAYAAESGLVCVDWLRSELEQVTRERDALAATVEALREAMAPTPEGAMAMLRRVRDILDKPPTAHLSERDARVRGEAIEEAARVCDDRAESLSEDLGALPRAYTRSARNCAAAIRSLSERVKGGDDASQR